MVKLKMKTLILIFVFCVFNVRSQNITSDQQITSGIKQLTGNLRPDLKENDQNKTKISQTDFQSSNKPIAKSKGSKNETVKSLTKESTKNLNKPCPDKCECFDSTVDCQKAGLTEIPSINEIPQNTKILILESNQIKRIAKFDPIPSLKKLVLKDNAIQDVEPEAFESALSLEDLDLSFNTNINFPTGLLNSLSHLKKLNLNRCNLSKLDPELFENNTKLTHLDLSNNPLIHLNENVFKNLKSLEYLNLENTKLTELRIGQDYPLNHLKLLNLNSNELELVPLFKYAPNIETLLLNHNKIRVMNKDTFPHLKNLENLEFSFNNEIMDIEELTFAQQTKLRRLVISNNPHLFIISSHAFYGLYNSTSFPLKELILSFNSFHTISEKLFMNHWDKLEILDLRGNPWTCNCHLKWLQKLQNHRYVEELRCKLPENLRGIYLKNVESKDLICKKYIDQLFYERLKSAVQVFILVIAFLVVILAFLLFYVMQDRQYSWTRMFGSTSSSTIYYQKANTKEQSILY